MPRVIKKGKAQELKVNCKKCNSIIGYFTSDIHEYSGTDRGGGPDGRRWVVCPNSECGKDIILESW